MSGLYGLAALLVDEIDRWPPARTRGGRIGRAQRVLEAAGVAPGGGVRG